VNLPGIVILGCGNVGNDIVSEIHRARLTGAETVLVNTDLQHLKISPADKRISIGKALKGGLGAGGCSIMGRRAIEYGIPVINTVIESTDLVFLAAGLGGGTGTGALPLIAEYARDNGSLVICFATLPSDNERYQWTTAMSGLKELLKYADSVIILDHRKIACQYPHLSTAEIYRKMDRMIIDTIRQMTILLTEPSLITIDFADLRVIFKDKGTALLLAGESEEGISNKNESVLQNSLAHPSMDTIITGASGCVICINGGSDINLFESEDIATAVSSTLDSHADVVWGLHVTREMEGKVRVLAVVTGLKEDVDEFFSESLRNGSNVVPKPLDFQKRNDEGVMEWLEEHRR